MKTHLLRPKDVLTMCGLRDAKHKTDDPSLSNCRTCTQMYELNVGWYWYLLDKDSNDTTKSN